MLREMLGAHFSSSVLVFSESGGRRELSAEDSGSADSFFFAFADIERMDCSNFDPNNALSVLERIQLHVFDRVCRERERRNCEELGRGRYIAVLPYPYSTVPGRPTHTVHSSGVPSGLRETQPAISQATMSLTG